MSMIIAQADVVIIAAGKGVNKDGFTGRRFMRLMYQEHWGEAEKVIDEALHLGMRIF